MLLLALHTKIIYTVTDMHSAAAAPEDSYIIFSDINFGVNSFTLHDFSGVLMGHTQQIQLEQQEPFVSGFTGLIIHLRVKQTIPTAFAGAHALSGGAGGVLRHVFVDLVIGDAAGKLRSGTISTLKGCGQMTLTNLTLSLRLGGGTESVTVCGLAGTSFSAPFANVTVHISVVEVSQVIGLALVVTNLSNTSVQIAGNKADIVSGLVRDADTLILANITVDIKFAVCEKVYTLLQSAGKTALSCIKIAVKLNATASVVAISVVANDDSFFEDILVDYDFILKETDKDEPYDNTCIWGLTSHGTGSLTSERVRVRFNIDTAHSIQFSGLSDVYNAVQTFSQAIVEGNIICTGSKVGLDVGGLSHTGYNGIYSSIYVNISISGASGYCYIGGLFAQQHGQVNVSSVHTNVTLLNFTGNGNIGAVAGMPAGVQRQLSYKSVLAALFLEQTAASASVTAGGFAGNAANVICKNLALYVDMRLKSAQTYAGGICGVAETFTCNQCAVTGTLRFSGASASNDSVFAGVVGKVTSNSDFTIISVDVNITSDVAMQCATFFAAASNTKLAIAISVGEVLECQRKGVAVPEGNQVMQVFELQTDRKKLFVEDVMEVSRDVLQAQLLQGFVRPEKMWRPIIENVPHLVNASHSAEDHKKHLNKFIGFCEPGAETCFITVYGLQNLIPDAIGKIANPYRLCQSDSCTSNCSGHGTFSNGTCECETGYIGDTCQEKLCTFEHARTLTDGVYRYCHCEIQYEYRLEQNDTEYVQICRKRGWPGPDQPYPDAPIQPPTDVPTQGYAQASAPVFAQ